MVQKRTGAVECADRVNQKGRPAQFLELQTGHEIPRRYVNNVVHLLKNAFQRVGLDRRLIETHERKGVRMALKHQSAPVIESDLR
jgi:hypothetical protein